MKQKVGCRINPTQMATTAIKTALGFKSMRRQMRWQKHLHRQKIQVARPKQIYSALQVNLNRRRKKMMVHMTFKFLIHSWPANGITSCAISTTSKNMPKTHLLKSTYEFKLVFIEEDNIKATLFNYAVSLCLFGIFCVTYLTFCVAHSRKSYSRIVRPTRWQWKEKKKWR